MDGDRKEKGGKSRKGSSEVIKREVVGGDRSERVQDAARKQYVKYKTQDDNGAIH